MNTMLTLATASRELIEDALGVGNHTLTDQIFAVALTASKDLLEINASVDVLQNKGLQLIERFEAMANENIKLRADLLNAITMIAHHDASHMEAVTNLRTQHEKDIKAAVEKALAPKRNGAKWTQYEEQRLVTLYRAGRSEEQIAKSLERFGDAICVRLGKIDNGGKCWRKNRNETEEQWTHRHRQYYFEYPAYSPLLTHKDVIGATLLTFPPHILEAFETVPQATRPPRAALPALAA